MPSKNKQDSSSARKEPSKRGAPPSAALSISDLRLASSGLLPEPEFWSSTLDHKCDEWDITQDLNDEKPQNSLSFNVRPLIIHAFQEVIEKSKGVWRIVSESTGWLIFQHAGSQRRFELQLELTKKEADKLPQQGDYTRLARVRTIPNDDTSKGFPDGVLSLLVNKTRVPVFYLDLKRVSDWTEAYAQLSVYMLQGFQRAKAVTGVSTARGALLNFDRKSKRLDIFGCDLTLRDFRFFAEEWKFPQEELSLTGFVQDLLRRCLEFVASPLNPSGRLQLVSWRELSAQLGPGLPPEAKEVSSRHTIFHATIPEPGGGFHNEYVKVLHALHLDDLFLSRQRALAAHMFEQLGDDGHVMAEWRTTPLGPHMWAVQSRDVGGPFKKNEPSRTRTGVINFIRALLKYCLIPPLEYDFKRYPVVHGDLRLANVTSNLQIIDFEFLGYLGSRAKTFRYHEDREDEHWEITYDQRMGRSSICTNVWQVGLLISQMFFEGSIVAMKTFKATMTNYITSKPVAQISRTYLEGLEPYLTHLRQSLLTEEVWNGTRAAAAAAPDLVRGLLENLAKLEAELAPQPTILEEQKPPEGQ